MLVKEYRVILPLEVEEFRRAQLVIVADTSKAETGGGEGVEVVKQEDFENSTIKPGETLKGTYTYKIYRIKSKCPWFIQKLLRDEAFELHEESWNAYPYSKTIITNPGYMKKDFSLIIESLHEQDNGEQENALNSQYPDREIIRLDIRNNEHLTKADLAGMKDIATFRSEKADRGPLPVNWTEEDDDVPVMCAYKQISVNFKWRGLQTRVENAVQNQYPRMLTKWHRDMFLSIDKWFDMTMDDIREYEMETQEQLKAQIDKGNKRGTKAAEEK